jgi:hypothetical protein
VLAAGLSLIQHNKTIMKKNRWLMPMILVGMLSMGLQCEKDPPLNPDDGLTELEKLDKEVPITSEGANTIGMLIDGKLWLPKDEPFGQPGVNADYNYEYGGEPNRFSLIGNYSLNENESNGFSIRLSAFSPLDTFLVLGKAAVMAGDSANYASFFIRKPQFDGYQPDSLREGFLSFSQFDTIIGIASGTFAFDAINKNGKVIKITNGRFDVSFPKPGLRSALTNNFITIIK